MRINPIQTNFTAGEITPKLYGRTDIERYGNAAKVMENVFVLVQGGAQRRYGTRYSAPAKHENKHAALIPYVFNRDQAYMLEFGDAYVRVFLDDGSQVMDGLVPYELATDYAEAHVDEVDYVQNGDTMLLLHEAYPPRRLRRFGDAAWVLDEIPWVTMPFAEIGTRPATTLSIDNQAVGVGRTLTAGAAAFMASDVGREVQTEGGLAVITAYTSATVVTAEVLTPFPAAAMLSGEWLIDASPMATLTPSIEKPVGETVTLTLGAAGWRSDDVGKFVELNGGRVRIETVASATSATGIITAELSAAVAAPALAWTLNGPVWGGVNGYPRTGTFYEQRLWLGGSPGFPQTLWGSCIGEYFDFELGTLDDDAISITLASDQQNAVLHLTSLKSLVAITSGGEFTIRGGNEKPITPTNVQVKQQSNFGGSTVSPERVGNELMFAQRARKKIRALSADRIDSDQYGAPDLTVLADHMTAPRVTCMAYVAEPDPLLFALREDGQLAVATVDRDQEVVGWVRQFSAGQFDAIAALPTDEGMQAWAIVIRQVNGLPVRYVERFDATLMTDCAITGASVLGDTVWAGLGHLEGLAVKVKADGVELNDRVVAGGEIEIERPAHAIEIGLPFTPRVELLRPEVMGPEGSSQSGNMRISEIVCRFMDTVGATINGQVIFGRAFGDAVFGTAPVPMTGDERVESLGWDRGDFRVVIEQPHPYPFHLQAVITTLTVNKG